MADEFRSGSSESSTFAFLTGALLGAAAGLLFAPRAGRELREQLSGYLRQSKDQWSEIGEQARHGVQRATERGREAIQKGREAMQSERERLGGGQST